MKISFNRGVGASSGRASGTDRGVVFIWVLVSLFVLAVFLMAAAQPISIVMRREREKELVFRGEAYTEAIRRYMKENHGTFPMQLKDLMKPGGPKRIRYIRHLYANPFARDGKWGLLAPGRTVVTIGEDGKFVYTPQGGSSMGSGDDKEGQPSPPVVTRPRPGAARSQEGGSQGNQSESEGSQEGKPPPVMVLPFRLDGKEGQPVLGVYCKFHQRAFKDFRGKLYYDEWLFSPLVIPPPLSPGRQVVRGTNQPQTKTKAN